MQSFYYAFLGFFGFAFGDIEQPEADTTMFSTFGDVLDLCIVEFSFS